MVAIDDLRPSSLLLAYAASSLSSAVLCPLPDGLPADTLSRCLETVSARALITRRGAPTSVEFAAPIGELFGPVSRTWDGDAVASDPLAILFAGLDETAPRAVVHNAHTLLAGNGWACARLGLSAEDRIAVANHDPEWAVLVLPLLEVEGDDAELAEPRAQRRDVGAQLLDPFLEERVGLEDAGRGGSGPGPVMDQRQQRLRISRLEQQPVLMVPLAVGIEESRS